MTFLSGESVEGEVIKLGTLKLKVSRVDALRHTQDLFLEGRGINALYICTDEELQTAQKRKLSWIAGAHELFNKIASGSQAADFFDQISVNVLKESAPIESLSELFHNELNQRLERLRMIRRSLEESPEPASPSPMPAPPPTAPSSRRPATPMPQPVVEPEEQTSPPPAEQTGVSSASGTLDFVVDSVADKQVANTRQEAPTSAKRSKVMLILCSRNGTARQAICRFANQMNLTLEIVDYNPDQPHAIIDLIYRHRDAKFAVVYWGEPNGRELPGYAHPERYVGFALGFALGRLGRGRVFIMGSTTTPPLPGFNRILVAQLDSTGGWQIQLARRMKAAGVDIDLNKLT